MQILHFQIDTTNFETSLSAFEKYVQDYEAVKGQAMDDETKRACLLMQTKGELHQHPPS